MKLTEREKRILKLLSEGLVAKQMADEFHLSKNRIRDILIRMRERFDCGNNEQMCVKAVRAGII